MVAPHALGQLQALPPGVLQRVLCFLPDPAALAATCTTAAALLDQDTLLLDWAQAALARNAASRPVLQHRHPCYALLLWRRLHCMDLGRVVSLLVQWAARQPHAAGPLNLGGSSITSVRQRLQQGDTVGALQALLPYSKHLLLLYAARARHMPLLYELLKRQTALWKADPTQCIVRLEWDEEDNFGDDANMLLPAALAAARSGNVEAMQALMEAVEAVGVIQDMDVWPHVALGANHGPQHVWTLSAREVVLAKLLDAAVRAGRPGVPCVLALLNIWHGPPLPAVMAPGLLSAAAAGGDEAVVRALLAAGFKAEPHGAALSPEHWLQPFDCALLHGHLHLLPRLVTGDGQDVARRICCKLSQHGLKCIRSEDAPQLALIPQAVLGVGEEASQPWDLCEMYVSVLRPAVHVGSLATLQAAWAALDADHGARTLLGWAQVRAVAEGPHAPCSATLQWLAHTVLPAIDGGGMNGGEASSWVWSELQGAAEGGALWQGRAAREALAHGHKELLHMLQTPEVVAQLVQRDGWWEAAAARGEVLSCARRGDAVGVAAALQALAQPDGPFANSGDPAWDWSEWDALGAQVVTCAAAMADGKAAEALVAAVAQYVLGMMDVAVPAVWAHKGRLLSALCKHAQPALMRAWVGASAVSPFGRLNFRSACRTAGVHALAALVTQPDQPFDYLSAQLVEGNVGHLSNAVIQDPLIPMHTIVGLLHLLAARRFEQQGPGVQGSGRCAGAGHRRAESGSVARAGSRGTGGQGGCDVPLPPFGARVLSRELLQGVLQLGDPDLLHAVLVYVDCWGPQGALATGT